MKVPEGWKLVPIELTNEMRRAAFNAPAYGHPETAVPTIPAMYEAMLAAAPTPPAQEDEPVGWLGFSPIDGVVEFCHHKPIDKVIKAWNFRKVYTRPQSDKLREVAEALLRDYDEEYGDFSEPYATRFESLRAALEEK